MTNTDTSTRVPTKAFQPSWESVSTRSLPVWFDDAKVGIFLHWGLYSVPAWAPPVENIQALLKAGGPKEMFRMNPYAEWYLNSMQVDGNPTQEHHREVWGAGFPYDGFRPIFDEGSATADLDALASLCRDAGANYVVLTTKHHEGFTLWPASIPHPVKGYYHAQRDLVGDLTDAVRAHGMRMGLYYSGGYDWPYNNAVLRAAADAALAIPSEPSYVAYATAHVRELIDRYAPSVLWNDIAWPGGSNLAELFAHYYNTVEDGVINDRWHESGRRDGMTDTLAKVGGELVQRLWRFIPDDKKELTFPGAHHYDFNTPEYTQFDDIVTKKWEATRGVGHSFGANHNERPEDIVTTTELVRSLCDIVSKNGNLLIGIGPSPDGQIPPEQQKPVLGMGRWLATHGEGIYGTRPWTQAATTTTEGTEVRFTTRERTVYAHLIDLPGRPDFGLRGVNARSVNGVRLLGVDEAITWKLDGDQLVVDLPERLPVAPVHTLAIEGL